MTDHPDAFLFIGGLHDGRRVRLRGEPPTAELIDEDNPAAAHLAARARSPAATATIRKTAYRRERITFAGGQVVTFYVEAGLDPLAAVRRLVAGYRR